MAEITRQEAIEFAGRDEPGKEMNMAETEWTAWLIEGGGLGPTKYRTMEQGMFTWTTDPLKALHFCRREDAERVAAEDEDAYYIREHKFMSGPPTDSERR